MKLTKTKIIFSALLAFYLSESYGQQPLQPVIVNPVSNASNVPVSTYLSVTATDPNSSSMSVSFYARPCPPSPGADFTIVPIPDTQYYTSQLNGGTNAMYKSQMNWIVNNRVAQNIVYVQGLGDCVENGDNVLNEWKRADTAVKIIENPVTTSLTYGIPYGMNVGNHDQTPTGSAGGTTTYFNQYFGVSRFAGRPYYGGNYGTNNNNNYVLFSASGIDFIVISLEYNVSPSQALLTWVKNLLVTYSNRRAIIVSHYIVTLYNTFGFEGEAIYNAVKFYPNVFLMLCGHITDESRRTDSYDGNIIHSLRSDYQDRTNGGNGWMRLMKFRPSNNTIEVKTYSPWLNQYETDTNSQFTINYDLSPFYNLLGTTNVASGSTTMMPYTNLLPNTCYQWYVKVSDGTNTTISPVQTFTTGTWSSNVSLNIKAFIEGFYRGNNAMTPIVGSGVTDTFTIEFRNALSPYSKVYSGKAAVNTAGNWTYSFPPAVYGNAYYICVKHRNSLDTWSAAPVAINSATVSYDFTTSANKAFGNNESQLPDGKFAIINGDVDLSGRIDSTDNNTIELAAKIHITGYSLYDLNGDSQVEETDGCILENNLNKFIHHP
jgi:hypothetical protein